LRICSENVISLLQASVPHCLNTH